MWSHTVNIPLDGESLAPPNNMILPQPAHIPEVRQMSSYHASSSNQKPPGEKVAAKKPRDRKKEKKPKKPPPPKRVPQPRPDQKHKEKKHRKEPIEQRIARKYLAGIKTTGPLYPGCPIQPVGRPWTEEERDEICDAMYRIPRPPIDISSVLGGPIYGSCLPTTQKPENLEMPSQQSIVPLKQFPMHAMDRERNSEKKEEDLYDLKPSGYRLRPSTDIRTKKPLYYQLNEKDDMTIPPYIITDHNLITKITPEIIVKPILPTESMKLSGEITLPLGQLYMQPISAHFKHPQPIQQIVTVQEPEPVQPPNGKHRTRSSKTGKSQNRTVQQLDPVEREMPVLTPATDEPIQHLLQNRESSSVQLYRPIPQRPLLSMDPHFISEFYTQPPPPLFHFNQDTHETPAEGNSPIELEQRQTSDHIHNPAALYPIQPIRPIPILLSGVHYNNLGGFPMNPSLTENRPKPQVPFTFPYGSN